MHPVRLKRVPTVLEAAQPSRGAQELRPVHGQSKMITARISREEVQIVWVSAIIWNPPFVVRLGAGYRIMCQYRLR